MARRPRATGGAVAEGNEGRDGSGSESVAFGVGGDGTEAVGSVSDNIDAPSGIGGSEESQSFETGAIDPGEIAGEAPEKRRRGRPKGSGRKQDDGPKEAKPGKLDLGVLASQIVMAHAVAASVLNCPQLQLTDGEAKALAGAVKTVAAQHDIGSIVNPKVQAWLGLIGVAGAVYIPRAQYIKEAVRTRNAKNVTPEGEVFPPGVPMG